MEVAIIGNGYAGLSTLDKAKIKEGYDTLVESGGFNDSFERFIHILEGPKELPKAIDLIGNSFFNVGLSMNEFSKSLEGFKKSKHNKAAALRFKSRHKKKR